MGLVSRPPVVSVESGPQAETASIAKSTPHGRLHDPLICMSTIASTPSLRAILLRLVFAWMLINAMLLAPHWLAAGGLGGLWIAAESGMVAGLFALLPRRRWTRLFATLAASVLVVLAIAVLADTVARQSLARPLNLYLDVRLLSAVLGLLRRIVGSVAATLLVPALLLGAGLLTWVIARLLEPAETARGSTLVRIIGAGLFVLSTLGLLGEQAPQISQRMAFPAVTVATQQIRHFSRMLHERDRFEAEMAASRAGYSDMPGLLQRLDGSDVVFGFVESYGMSAIADPRYADVVVPRLHELARRMAAANLHLATGALVAPIQGGQSWLGRGSVLSGLWLENQLRYDLLLASSRQTLIDDFRHAGYRTVALMPAITLAWPEGERLGYDEIYAHKDIDYAGPALNWVTMPDQFTWSYLEQRIRRPDDSRPLFAEVGLISSHAPWTPILTLLDDWSTIGNGEIFSPWEGAGERPVDLWRDHDRVRHNYALSIDYAIQAATAYAERFVDERTLLLVLGDHQPAPIITGHGASRASPVHVITANRALLEPFLEWGFAEGGLPDPNRTPPRMDAFRDWFVSALSTP